MITIFVTFFTYVILSGVTCIYFTILLFYCIYGTRLLWDLDAYVPGPQVLATVLDLQLEGLECRLADPKIHDGPLDGGHRSQGGQSQGMVTTNLPAHALLLEGMYYHNN